MPNANATKMLKAARKVARPSHAKKARDDMKGSFKAAVPGNLGDNTKPVTRSEQGKVVDYLKKAGVLPKTEKAADYPVLTAKLKRQIIAELLRLRELELVKAVTAWPTASFKDAVPGNLGDNTRPTGKAAQKESVDYLKDAGVLPKTEKAADYPPLAAEVQAEIIAELIKAKRPDLAKVVAQKS